jgi:AraC-like DNA-binding protein
MQPVEKYFTQFEKYGFRKESLPGITRYKAPAELGQGGFDIAGNVDTCYASIGDMTLYEDIILIQYVNEKLLSFGNYGSGDVDLYEKRPEAYPVGHGLNFQVNYPPLTGYMRMKAHERIICTGLILREKFIEEMLPDGQDDFWISAAGLININCGVLFPQLVLICGQIDQCKLTGIALEIFIRGKGMESFAMILDYLREHREKVPMRLSPQDKAEINKVKEILRGNITNPPSIKELARIARMNQQKLMAGFKQVTGSTIYGYLKNIRMEKTIELLQNTDMSVIEVARAVGYHGDGHFQQVFASVFGTTPSKARKELHKDFK